MANTPDISRWNIPDVNKKNLEKNIQKYNGIDTLGKNGTIKLCAGD
jgi:hypothetical protein